MGNDEIRKIGSKIAYYRRLMGLSQRVLENWLVCRAAKYLILSLERITLI